MRGTFLAAALAASAAFAGPAAAAVTVTAEPGLTNTSGSTTDPLNNATVTANSDPYPTFSVADVFGAVTQNPGSPFPESQAGGTFIFSDVVSPGFIDFQTTSPVILESINALVASDGTDPFRAFATLTLFAGSTAGSLTSLGTANISQAGAFRVNFTTDTTAPLQFFRFEGTNFTNGGARLVEIDGLAAVPEPSTWAMMLAGFGLVGGAMRSARGRRSLLAA